MMVEKKWATTFLIAICILMTILAIISDGYEGGADTVGHYLYSRHAINNPILLLDLWGRPIFTLFGIPFAQFGFTIMKFYSILLSLLTAWIGYKILEHLEYKGAFLYIPMVTLAPYYLLLSISPLTETLFGFTVVLAIWLYYRRRYTIMTLVISLLPFVRFEGFIIFPPFILILLLNKRFKDIPLLFSGYFIFSIIGYFAFNDLLWLIHKNPYSGSASAIYGHGSLFHYLSKAPYIIGTSNALLVILGIIYLVVNSIIYHTRRKEGSTDFAFLILAGGSFLSYFIAHSYVWYKGAGNSLGLLRIMVAIIPLAVLLASYAVHKILIHTQRIKFNTLIISILISGSTLYFSRIYQYPLKWDIFQSTVHEASEWIKENKLDKKKIYYYSILFSQELNLNVFEPKTNGGIMIHFDYKSPFEIPNDSYYFWDSQFGSKEGGVTISQLFNQREYQLIKYFAPDTATNNFKIDPYEILVFYKYNQNHSTFSDNLRQYIGFRTEKGIFDNVYIIQDSFENNSEDKPYSSLINTEQKLTGEKSIKVNNDIEFLLFNELDLDLTSPEYKKNHLTTLKLSVWVKLREIQTEKNLIHFVAAQDKNPLLYFSRTSNDPVETNNEWINLTLDIPLKYFNKEGKIKIYMWNPGKNSFYVDDFSLSFY